MTQTAQATPWYRNRWPWFVFSIPVLTIFLCAVLLALAISSNDGLVADDYYKQGLGINQQLGRQEEARRLSLGAQVVVSPEGGAIRVLMGRVDTPELKLLLVHPTRAGEDRLVLLTRNAEGLYEGALPFLSPGRWYVHLEDEASTWRLNGEWHTAERSFILRSQGS